MQANGLFGPDRHLVPGRIDKVKAPAAGEREDRLDDRAAGIFDGIERFLQIPAIEHGQRLGGRFRGVTQAEPGQWELIVDLYRDDARVFRSRSRVMLNSP